MNDMKIYKTNQESINKGILYTNFLIVKTIKNKHFGWDWNSTTSKKIKVCIIKDNRIKGFCLREIK